MRYLIRCDMEGITGVTTYAEVTPGAPLYPASQQLLMSDLLAVIEGLREGDPQAQVLLYDEHFYGRNVLLDQLPDFCRAIVGKPRYRADWPGGLDQTIDAMLMVGFHAMAGTPGGTLPHTYEHDITAIHVGRTKVGEVGVESGLAGELGIPMILYSGDSAGAVEAQALMPGLAAVVVKESIDEEAALCLGTAESVGLLRQAAAKVAGGSDWPQPLRPGSVGLRLELAAGPYREAFEKLHRDRISGGQVELNAGSLAAGWAEYWVLKEQAQAQADGH